MAFLGIDWGTSSLRAFLIDEDGSVLSQHHSDNGIKRIEGGDFAAILAQVLSQFSKLLDNMPIVMCGMIGSAQGWHEAAYLKADVSVSNLAKACFSFTYQTHPVFIIPGLCLNSFAGKADVMRGEETIYVGAADGASSESHYYCLPGTHSKWIHAEKGVITAFASFMTGEMFEWASLHSMLAPVLIKPKTGDDFNHHAFQEGLAHSEDDLGLLHHLFSVRAEIVSGRQEGHWGYAMASGLIIGAEIKAMANRIAEYGGHISLVCPEKTKNLYMGSLKHYRLEASHKCSDTAVIKGLRAVYQQL